MKAKLIEQVLFAAAIMAMAWLIGLPADTAQLRLGWLHVALGFTIGSAAYAAVSHVVSSLLKRHEKTDDQGDPQLLKEATRATIAIFKEQTGDESYGDTAERLAEEARKYRESQDDDATTVFVRPQPAPQNADGPAIWPIVCEELERDYGEIGALVAKDGRRRNDDGIAKYGVPLVVNNGRDHLIDLYQEKLDAIVYAYGYHEKMRHDSDSYSAQLLDHAFESAIEVREEIARRDGV